MLKIAFDKKYVLPLPEGHRFPMLKYELICDSVVVTDESGVVTLDASIMDDQYNCGSVIAGYIGVIYYAVSFK